jgi:uncharacterized protein YbaR (Trm112 family)
MADDQNPHLPTDLLSIARCPRCQHDPNRPADDAGRLERQEEYIVCCDCGLRYPIEMGFPALMENKALPPLQGPDPRNDG